MEFKDWFEERLIEVDNVTYLDNIEYGFFPTTKEIIEKIYNFFKDDFDMIDFLDIVHCKNYSDIVYNLVFKNDLICYESLIYLLKLLNNNEALKNMEIDLFYRLFVNAHKIDIMNDEFYCLMSLNPKFVDPEYIIQFEDYINKFLPEYTNINHLHNVFESELILNAELNAIVQTNFDLIGIVCFETKEQLEEYKAKTRASIITDDDLEDAKSKLESVSTAVKVYISNKETLLN